MIQDIEVLTYIFSSHRSCNSDRFDVTEICSDETKTATETQEWRDRTARSKDDGLYQKCQSGSQRKVGTSFSRTPDKKI